MNGELKIGSCDTEDENPQDLKNEEAWREMFGERKGKSSVLPPFVWFEMSE